MHRTVEIRSSVSVISVSQQCIELGTTDAQCQKLGNARARNELQ